MSYLALVMSKICGLQKRKRKMRALMLSMLGAVAEFESAIINERRLEGSLAANQI